jgi:ABC-2 type transport system permease protein
LSKFVSALTLVGSLLLTLSLLMVGGGILITGVLIEAEEVFRIVGFTILCTVYVGFWLGLSILLSILFKQASTSALTAIGIWLFFTVFYQIIIDLIVPAANEFSETDVIRYNRQVLNLLRLSPSQLFTDATTTLLMPSVRSLGPITMEQMAGAIPSPLPLRDSLMIVWPQLSGLIAATTMCFAASYYLFMRREIRG